MAQTVTALSAEVTKSQAYLDRVRQSENNAALGGGPAGQALAAGRV